jgi:hypothetical protein
MKSVKVLLEAQNHPSFLGTVSNRLLAEKIILALDDYGRKIHSVEYGLPIDPDTKDFESKRPQEMLKIVMDILNAY